MKHLVLALLATTALAQPPCPTHEAHCDPRAQLAMDYMMSHFGDQDSDLSVWLDKAYGTAGRLRLERRENKFEQLEKWANTLAPDDKRAYLGVIQWYEDGAKKAYAEWHTHDLQHRQQAFEEYLRKCAEAARQSANSHPLPKPPEDSHAH